MRKPMMRTAGERKEEDVMILDCDESLATSKTPEGSRDTHGNR